MTETRPIPIVACLAGDGIGPEVMAEAGRVIDAVSELFGVRLRQVHLPFGGEAIDRHRDPFPAHVRAAVKASDAVLLGAVGGPRWNAAPRRPEQGLLDLRKELDAFANLRPVRHGDIDLIVVRELTGGLYFGAKLLDDDFASDTLHLRPRPDRARGAVGVPARPPPLRPGGVGRQAERARHVEAVAAGGDASCTRPSSPRSSSPTSWSTRSR